MTAKSCDRLADVLAMVTFSFITGMFIEMVGISLVSDQPALTLRQSLASRLSSIPLNMLTARPFGIYRDFVRATRPQAGAAERRLLDLAAFLTFQIPIYVVILLAVGSTWPQVISAASLVILFSVVLGPLYGLYLDAFRRGIARLFLDETEAPQG